jgi:hypothetical protein
MKFINIVLIVLISICLNKYTIGQILYDQISNQNSLNVNSNFDNNNNQENKLVYQEPQIIFNNYDHKAFGPQQYSEGITNNEYQLNQLINSIDNQENSNQFIPNRDKKSKYQDSNFNFQNDYNTNKQTSCAKKFKHETNVIIDTTNSIKKGALLLGTEYISKETASLDLNSLQNNCISMCCENSQCDAALLSMKMGLVNTFLPITI